MTGRIRRAILAFAVAASSGPIVLAGTAHAGSTVVPCAFSIGDVTLAEGNAGTTSFVFTITQTTDSPTAIPDSVDYATADGTAGAPLDYTTTTGTASFTPDSKTETVIVPVVGDVGFEGDETFFVNLTPPSSPNCTISDNQAVGTITNDDADLGDPDPDPDPVVPTGYRLTALDGGVFCYGESSFHGGANSVEGLAAPIIDIDETPDRSGYWQAGLDGGVFAWNAPFFGNALDFDPTAPILGIAARPQGDGYWLVGIDGGVFALGDAPFLGNAVREEGAVIVDIQSTPSGSGYWLLDANGTVYDFGDAVHLGDHEAMDVEAVGLAPTPTGTGYWITNVPGNVFEFGTATDHGQIADPESLVGSIVTIEAPESGDGYWLLGFDGGVFAFDAPFYGSAVNLNLNAPVIAMAGKR